MATTGSAAAAPAAFTGFTPAALQFLADLAVNNDRAWFTPRKAELERLLKLPMQALCAALAEAFARHGVPLTADPARSPFRIHRDTRFSKDKAPYKLSHSAGFGWAGATGGEGGRGGGDQRREEGEPWGARVHFASTGSSTSCRGAGRSEKTATPTSPTIATSTR